MARRRRDEAGAVAIVTALCMVMLLIVGGIVMDLGRARVSQMASQNAADASALAAINALYPATSCAGFGDSAPPCLNSAVAAAKDYAQKNFGVAAAAWSQTCSFEGSFTPAGGQTSCVQFDSLTQPSKVWVQIPARDVEMTLGKLAGVEEVSISMRAQAALSQGNSGDCGFCVLGTSSMSGNPHLTVTNAGVGINGKPSFSGNVDLDVVNGTFTTEQTPNKSGNVSFSPNPTVGVRVSDPFLGIPLPPSLSGMTVHGNVSKSGNGACSLSPGIYGNISVSGNHTCNLSPGLYAITGTMSFSGNSVINASSGVTLYFTCGTPAAPHECGATWPFSEVGGSLRYSGNQTLKVVAPSTGPTKGFAILYDRNNSNSLNYSGNQANVLQGSIYAAKATMNMSGNSGTIGMNSAIVVQGVNLSGNAHFNINYTKEANPTQSKPSIGLSR
ncbi:MAG TPA: pilus assembly protein TadG-related protein [Marmoricola sp.]|nr:pilus assembly protein TadG-related protein [Marmoricola sp.]